MGFFKFVFVFLIVLPVAVFMFVILKKLTGEYNAEIKKQRDIKSGKYQRDLERAKYEAQPEYRKNNPQYAAYRRRMEEGIVNRKERE